MFTLPSSISTSPCTPDQKQLMGTINTYKNDINNIFTYIERELTPYQQVFTQEKDLEFEIETLEKGISRMSMYFSNLINFLHENGLENDICLNEISEILNQNTNDINKRIINLKNILSKLDEASQKEPYNFEESTSRNITIIDFSI